MVMQLLRCVANCFTGRGRESASGDGTAAVRPSPESDVPAGLRELMSIPGIGPKTAKHLAEGGYTTVEEVRAASEEDLAAVEGVGPRAAATLKKHLAG